MSPFSLEPNVERVTAECHRRRRLGLTVTSACAPSYMPTTSFKLLACHRHGDWALPCMARASSFLTSHSRTGQGDITHSTRVLRPAGRNVAHEYEFNVLTPPSDNGLVDRKTECLFSANVNIICSAILSHSHCGLSSLIEYHFFSEPGARNDHCPGGNLLA